MKVEYKFADGTVSEVEVSEEIGTYIMDSRRKENSANRKERYHCSSLDAILYEGSEFGYEEGNYLEEQEDTAGHRGRIREQSADDAVCTRRLTAVRPSLRYRHGFHDDFSASARKHQHMDDPRRYTH